MLKPKVTQLPGHIQSVYVQNVIKLYSRILSIAEESDDTATITETNQMLIDRLPMFIQSGDLEVQERVGVFVLITVYLVIHNPNISFPTFPTNIHVPVHI